MQVNASIPFRFKYHIEVVRNGVVLDEETAYNIVPTEGLDHVLNTVMKAGTPVAAWFIGLFEGNYTPVAGVTAATIATSATESTAYAESTRVAWTGGSVSAGVVDNSASRAEFTINASKTIYGGFLVSAAAKGGTTGTLISAVRFATAKVLEAGDVLRISAGITLTSV